MNRGRFSGRSSRMSGLGRNARYDRTGRTGRMRGGNNTTDYMGSSQSLPGMQNPFGGKYDGSGMDSVSTVSRDTGSTATGCPSNDVALLGQATSQAMLAAKTILLSGGNDLTALKTARAAAESVLLPDSKFNDNSSVATGRSTMSVRRSGFGYFRRRRLKRQAEVIASMALTSATEAVMHEKNNAISEGEALKAKQKGFDSKADALLGHRNSPRKDEMNDSLMPSHVSLTETQTSDSSGINEHSSNTGGSSQVSMGATEREFARYKEKLRKEKNYYPSISCCTGL